MYPVLTGIVEIYLGVMRDALRMVTPGQMVDVHADYCDYACVGGGAGCVQTVCPELFWSHPQPTNFLKIRTDQPFHPAQGCRHGGMRTEKGSRLRVLDMDIRMTSKRSTVIPLSSLFGMAAA